jgi:hypothetical protein
MNYVIKPIGTAPALKIVGTFYDHTTDTLTFAIDLRIEVQRDVDAEPPPLGNLSGIEAEPLSLGSADMTPHPLRADGRPMGAVAGALFNALAEAGRAQVAAIKAAQEEPLAIIGQTNGGKEVMP